MSHPSYQTQGWQIGSDAMKSGCKTVVGQRLCNGEMRWGVEVTDSVSHLRALFQGEPKQWEAFWSQSRK